MNEVDLRKMGKTILISAITFYSINIILSVTLYSILSYIGLPVNDVIQRSVLVSVPLISGIFNAIILTMIAMSLKLAEYYGIAKSVLALIIYLAYMIAFSPPIFLVLIMVSIMALNVAQMFLLYYYAKLQKLLFG